MNTIVDPPVFWPPDLFESFARHFYAKGIIGGLKAWGRPHSPQWIIHGRFLLTKTTDQILASLFWQGYKSISGWDSHSYSGQFPHHSHAAAAFLAGILKKRQFLPEILRLIPESTSGWYGTGPYLALALMNDAETEAQIETCREDETCREGANLALELIRKDQLIDHLGANGAKQIRNGISCARRLRAGIEFDNDLDLKRELSHLLRISTPPLFAMEGCLAYTPARNFKDGEASIGPRLEKEVEPSMLAIINRSRREGMGGLPTPRHEKLENDWSFTRAVQDFHREGGGPYNLARVLAAARQTEFPQDLFGGLEVDWMYHLPADVIMLVYERLLKLLPASDSLLESYAYAMLMCKNGDDNRAQQLLKKAGHLQKGFRWVIYRYSVRFAVTLDYELQEGESFMPEKGSQIIFNHR